MNSSGDVTRLAVLGLLKTGPNHGYGLRAILESWQVHRWLDVKYGAIYASLKRLTEDGSVQVTGVESDRGPTRTTYKLTKKGEKELERLARVTWVEGAGWSLPIDLLLTFLSYDWLGASILPRDEVAALLRQRIDRLTASIDSLAKTAEDTLARTTLAPLHAIQRLHFDHGIMLIKTEVAWTRDVLAGLERGDFEMPS